MKGGHWVAACAAVTLVACRPDLKPNGAKRTVLVLMDISESTSKPEMRRLYEESIDKMLATISFGDAFIAAWINDRSVGQLELPVEAPFPAFTVPGGNDNPDVIADERAKQCKDLKARLAATRDRLKAKLSDPRPPVMSTDILGSLALAERVFKSYPRDRAELLILSDMLQATKELNFEAKAPEEGRTTELLRQWKAGGSLPNFRGLRVWVAGAAGGGGAQFESFNAVRSFWLRYFEATGAKLAKEDYGGALVGFTKTLGESEPSGCEEVPQG